MPLSVAYPPDELLTPGTLPPAYGNGWAIPGQLQPAYGNDGFIFNDPGIGFDSRITFTRSTLGAIYGPSGTLREIAIDVARANANQDYNPSTLAARGFLIEAGATNGIRNPRCEGAAAGSPGTMPTNWTGAAPTEITRTVVGTGTEDGIPYVDIRYAGTVTAARDISLMFEASNSIAASAAQLWTGSIFARLVGGSFANMGAAGVQQFNAQAYTAAVAFISNFGQQAGFAPTSAALRTQRYLASGTTPANTAFVTLNIFMRTATTGAVDFTLRLGASQLEQNAFATSLILPPVASPAATARGIDSGDILSLPTIGFSATQGYLKVRAMFEGVGSSNTRRVLGFNDGTTNNEIAIVMADGGSDLIRFLATSGGVSQADISTTVAAAANTLYTIVVTWGPNGFKASCNGTGGTPATGTIPTVTRLSFGKDGAGANSQNGWQQSVEYGPVELTQAQINTMSGS
jgi:hypothetical protein